MDQANANGWVSDWDAIHTHGLRQRDLNKLQCERRYTPEVPREGMRLKRDTAYYRAADILRVKSELELKEQERTKKRKAKQAKEKQRRLGVQQAAIAQVQTFKHIRRKEPCSKSGDVKIPDEVLQQIIACLAVVELDGIRGPAMVANDLAHAALVSWDFYNAAKHGFAALEQQIKEIKLQPTRAPCCTIDPPWQDPKRRSLQVLALQHLPFPCSNHIHMTMEEAAELAAWQQIVANPLSRSLKQLQAAAQQLHVTKTGTKAVLVTNVLGAFCLKAPTNMPVHVLQVLALERLSCTPWEGCKQLSKLCGCLLDIGATAAEQLMPGIGQLGQRNACFRHCVYSNGDMRYSAARTRKMLFAAGVRNKQQLMQLQQHAAEEAKRVQEQRILRYCPIVSDSAARRVSQSVAGVPDATVHAVGSAAAAAAAEDLGAGSPAAAAETAAAAPPAGSPAVAVETAAAAEDLGAGSPAVAVETAAVAAPPAGPPAVVVAEATATQTSGAVLPAAAAQAAATSASCASGAMSPAVEVAAVAGISAAGSPALAVAAAGVEGPAAAAVSLPPVQQQAAYKEQQQ